MDCAEDRSVEAVKQRLKELLIESLALEDITVQDIGDNTPLFGDDGLGLDSLDGVEIVVMLQRHYGLDVKEMQKAREVFQTVETLAATDRTS